MNIAVIGCGRIAGHHCRSIVKTPGLKLAAVCDLVLEKAQAYGKEFNVPAYRDYREMLRKHGEINLVVVATPSGMHFEHGMEMLKEYRKSIVVEKPTFMRPSQVTAAFTAARQLGLHVFPVFQNRHNKAVRRVLQGLKSAELGKIRVASVRVRWCRPQRYYDLAPWRGTFSQDGGALTNQGIHHLDLIRYFCGEADKISATMRTLGANIEVEDTVVGSMAFQNGAVGTLEITTAARPDDFEASISLVCENGLAQIGGIAVNELQVYTPNPNACKEHSEDFSRIVYGHGHEQIYKDISDSSLGQRQYPVDEKDCLKTIQHLHAFYRSDEKKGVWVDAISEEESPRLGRTDESLADLYRATKQCKN